MPRRKLRTRALACLVMLLSARMPAWAIAPVAADGSKVYEEKCASCHNGSVPRAPQGWGVSVANTYSDPATKTSDAIVAFDLKTGKFLWSQQFLANDAWNVACGLADESNCPRAKGPDLDFGSSPILQKLADGKRVLVAGQKSGTVFGIDPDNTVNGVKANGGLFDASGPTIVDGVVYMNSGSGQFGGLAGNVLLAFSVDGK